MATDNNFTREDFERNREITAKKIDLKDIPNGLTAGQQLQGVVAGDTGEALYLVPHKFLSKKLAEEYAQTISNVSTAKYSWEAREYESKAEPGAHRVGIREEGISLLAGTNASATDAEFRKKLNEIIERDDTTRRKFGEKFDGKLSYMLEKDAAELSKQLNNMYSGVSSVAIRDGKYHVDIDYAKYEELGSASTGRLDSTVNVFHKTKNLNASSQEQNIKDLEERTGLKFVREGEIYTLDPKSALGKEAEITNKLNAAIDQGRIGEPGVFVWDRSVSLAAMQGDKVIIDTRPLEIQGSVGKFPDNSLVIFGEIKTLVNGELGKIKASATSEVETIVSTIESDATAARAVANEANAKLADLKQLVAFKNKDSTEADAVFKKSLTELEEANKALEEAKKTQQEARASVEKNEKDRDALKSVFEAKNTNVPTTKELAERAEAQARHDELEKKFPEEKKKELEAIEKLAEAQRGVEAAEAAKKESSAKLAPLLPEAHKLDAALAAAEKAATDAEAKTKELEASLKLAQDRKDGILEKIAAATDSTQINKIMEEVREGNHSKTVRAEVEQLAGAVAEKADAVTLPVATAAPAPTTPAAKITDGVGQTNPDGTPVTTPPTPASTEEQSEFDKNKGGLIGAGLGLLLGMMMGGDPLSMIIGLAIGGLAGAVMDGDKGFMKFNVPGITPGARQQGGDGQTQETEVAAGQGKAKTGLAQFDKNNDGILSQQEFNDQDKNKSGGLSADEMPKDVTPADFERLMAEVNKRKTDKGEEAIKELTFESLSTLVPMATGAEPEKSGRGVGE